MVSSRSACLESGQPRRGRHAERPVDVHIAEMQRHQLVPRKVRRQCREDGKGGALRDKAHRHGRVLHLIAPDDRIAVFAERVMHKLAVRRLGVDPDERLSGEIGAGHLFLAGQRMVAMDQKHVRFGEDFTDVQIPVLGADDRDPELDLARLDQFVDAPHRLVMELYGDIGTFLAELPQDRRKVVIGDGRQAGERQAILLGVAAFAQAVIGLGQKCKVAPHLGQERLSFLGQQ